MLPYLEFKLRKPVWLIQILFVLALIFYSHFYKLGALPYRIWDEARLACNAYEMSKDGDLLVTHIDGKPEMWNTKPPMMIWAQAACIKLLGLSEKATRLPAALCALVTVLMVAGFIYRITGSSWAGVLGAVVLCTSLGYMGFHGSRYGEYDSMLAMFTTAYILSFLAYTNEESERRNTFLLLFFALLTGAVLTKSIAGLLFLPSLAMYALFTGKVTDTLKNRYFYIGAIGFVVVVFGYYLLREQYNPGYIQAVFDNELGGRFNAVNEGHEGPWNYYLLAAVNTAFVHWYKLLLVIPIAVLFTKSKPVKKAMLLVVLAIVQFAIVISASKTKLEWYSLPAYPLLAILLGLCLYGIATALKFVTGKLHKAIVALLVVFVSYQPLTDLCSYIDKTEDDLNADSLYAPSYFLRKAINNEVNLNNVVYLNHEYTYQWQLYLYRLIDAGKKIRIENFDEKNTFKSGTKLMATSNASKEYVEANYTFTLLESFYSVKLYLITGPKQEK